MQTPILIKEHVSITQFINFWSSYYIYAKIENYYIKNINKKVFDSETLNALFMWKNGSVLSKKKKDSLNKNIIRKIEIINSLKNKFDFDLFKKEFKNVSVIWKIFLLNLIKPKTYPIFDQHVFRAMKFIKFSKIEEVPNNDREKEEVYFDEYIDFFNKIKAELPRDFDNKKIDEALWSFGKFLKSNYKTILC